MGEKKFNQYANSNNIINWNPRATMTYVPEIQSPLFLVNQSGRKQRKQAVSTPTEKPMNGFTPAF